MKKKANDSKDENLGPKPATGDQDKEETRPVHSLERQGIVERH